MRHISFLFRRPLYKYWLLVMMVLSLIPASWYALAASSTRFAPTKLILDEEFNEQKINTALWNIEFHDNTSPHHELQYFIPQDDLLSNGSLLLEAERQHYKDRKYTTGEVTTAGKFSFTYGRIDIRAKTLKGKGIKPALWLLGAKCKDEGQCNNKWPEPGYEEIDVMESLGQTPDQIYMINHYGPHKHNLFYQCIYTGVDYSQAYHIYSLIWKPGQLTWLIDGQQRCVSTVGVPSTPMFIVLSTTVGGDFAGNPNKSTKFPASMAVDYIHVSQ